MTNIIDAHEHKKFVDEIRKQYNAKNVQALEDVLRSKADEYYNGIPTIEDWKYDALKDLLRNLNATSRFLYEVGVKPRADSRVKLPIKMLSLDKISFTDIESWIRYKDRTDFIMEAKADGVASQLVYTNGKLHRGMTRGDKTMGDDITRHVMKMPSIPKEIPMIRKHAEFIVTGEIVIEKDVFKTNFSEYSNPRNTTSGLLHRLETDDSHHMSFFVYNMFSDLAFRTQVDIRNFIGTLGFNVIPGWFVHNNVNEVKYRYTNIAENRDDFDFDIDGVVLKVNVIAEQNRLGELATSPKWACCMKFEPKGALTKLISIKAQVGRTGEITPVAIVDPVTIDNVTITNITLHNYNRIKELNLRIHDDVYIIRANDVIPRLERNDTVHHDEWTEDNSKIHIPKLCPVCGSDVSVEWPRIFCRNDTCIARSVMYVKHYIKVHRILGIGDEFLRDNSLVSTPSDLYALNPRMLETCYVGASMIGWSRANAICSEIEKSKVQTLSKFIWGIGMPLVGEGKSADIAKHVKTIDMFKKYISDPNKYMKNIPGIGDEIISLLITYNSQIQQRIDSLLKYVKVTDEVMDAFVDKCWAGFSFCITGTLSKPRQEFIKLIIENGAAFNKNPTKLTSATIVGDKPGANKIASSKKFGVPILTEAEFIDTLGKDGAIKLLLEQKV